jgi:hypothetical protein
MQLVSFEVFVLPIFFHKILEDELTWSIIDGFH